MQNPDKDTIFSVSELNKLARSSLEKQFARIMVEGEISDLLQHRSGHWYLTLKDDNAQLRVAMFKSSNHSVRFQPENGQQIILRGKVTLYEPRGSYQFVADSMEPSGLGKLHLAFDQLKRDLSQQGLFDPDKKQSLPALSKQVVIITSPQGAAIKDMISTFKRRFPATQLTIIPVAVQGDGAAQQIAAAIETANRVATIGPTSKHHSFTLQPDAIIIGRGGGSLEDLWAFNEAVVAHAIFQSRLPIISAVGHETDFTIADLVADVRAATPTAAAEILSIEQDKLMQQLSYYTAQLKNRVFQNLSIYKHHLNSIANKIQHPNAKIQQQSQMLDFLDNRMLRAINSRFKNNKQRLLRNKENLQIRSPQHSISMKKALIKHYSELQRKFIAKRVQNARQTMEQLAKAMDIVSPLATLSRGYAIIEKDNETGEILRSYQDVNKGDKIKNRLSDGEIICTVDKTYSTNLSHTVVFSKE